VRRGTTSLAVLLPASILLVLGKGGWASAAEERRYALIIGQNTVPAGAGDRAPQPLKFADDDALSFYDLRRELGDEAILLVSPDPETRRRFQQSAEAATPPTLAALDRAVAALAEKMAADKQAHRASVFSFFFSGHGVRGADGQVGLALQDVEDAKLPELGWLLARPFWGLGYATEAGRAARRLAGTRWGYPSVISLIRPENTPSRRVAERVGLVAGREVDFHDFRHIVYEGATTFDDSTPA